VTLRQLLCHSAGLTVHGFSGYPPGQPLPTLRQLLDGEPPANSPPVRVDVLPGTICRYSGGGYCVLQQLLCDVTGADFAALMRELVLEPLGMAHSSFVQPLLPSWADAAAIGHGWMTRVPVAGGRHSYPEQAAAGLWTTAGDLARFAIGVQAAYAGAAGGLLSAELAREMLTPQLGDEHAGLGLWLSGAGEGRRFGHSGSNEGFICEMIAFAQGGCGAAVMTNGQAGSALVAELMRAIAVEYRWPGYLPEQRQPVAADPLALAACGGVYEARPGVRITVTPSNGGLALSFADQPALALLPAADGSFFAEALNCEASFRREGQAPAHELVITQAGRETLAKRLQE
jgi:CubicO group peptidase (beta-lactamase class C family)